MIMNNDAHNCSTHITPLQVNCADIKRDNTAIKGRAEKYRLQLVQPGFSAYIISKGKILGPSLEIWAKSINVKFTNT